MSRLLVLVVALLQLSSAFQLTARPAALRRTASPDMKLKLKNGDMVEVITGDEKGETGKIINIDRAKGKVWVEGLKMESKHVKPMKEGETGRIMKREGAIHISNLKVSSAAAPVAEPAA